MRPLPPFLSPRVTVSHSSRSNGSPTLAYPGLVTSLAQLATWEAGLKAETMAAPPQITREYYSWFKSSGLGHSTGQGQEEEGPLQTLGR